MDLGRIGVMGHSFGAFTTMVIAGMRPALDWIEPRVDTGKGLGPDLSDQRVKCGVALSPQAPGDPFFLPESYKTLRVPLIGISGTEDRQQNGEAPVARLDSFKLWPEMQGRNIFVWLANAAHLDFTDSTGGEQQGRSSKNRADVQRVVRVAILKFFNQCLRPEASQDPGITTDSLKPYLGGSVNRAEVLRR
jgi:predicted dienelactone hydrolase